MLTYTIYLIKKHNCIEFVATVYYIPLFKYSLVHIYIYSQLYQSKSWKSHFFSLSDFSLPNSSPSFLNFFPILFYLNGTVLLAMLLDIQPMGFIRIYNVDPMQLLLLMINTSSLFKNAHLFMQNYTSSEGASLKCCWTLFNKTVSMWFKGEKGGVSVSITTLDN